MQNKLDKEKINSKLFTFGKRKKAQLTKTSKNFSLEHKTKVHSIIIFAVH